MNEVELLAQPCIRLKVSEQKTGCSYLGGFPYASSKFGWPRKNERPLSFIAQLDLGELNKKQIIDWLPNCGRLLFFYDLENWPWGFDPKDDGGWAVIYDVGEVACTEITPPEDLMDEYRFSFQKYVQAKISKCYPDPQRVDLSKLGFNPDQELDKYYEYIHKDFGDEPHHQIGGFPHPIQNDSMEEQSHLVSNGINCGDSESYTTPKAEQLRKELYDWRLLFQFDSDDDIDAMWGDTGMLYFWIRVDDAKNRIFDKTWLILQCC